MHVHRNYGENTMAGHGSGHTEAQKQRNRYEEIKKDRDYWKKRALEDMTATYRDGRMMGIILTNLAWVALGALALFTLPA